MHKQIVYNVFFVGSVVSPMNWAPVEVETYATKKAARDRVAAYLMDNRRGDWTVIDRGHMWECDDGNGSVAIKVAEIHS